MKSPIAKYREEKKLTQAEVALLLNTAQSCVALWERGGLRLSKETIKQLGIIFHIQPEVLEKELNKFYESEKRELRERLGC